MSVQSFFLGQIASTLVDLLQWRATHQPTTLAYTFLGGGETQSLSLTYGELDMRCRAIGAALRAHVAPGERALLLYQPGLDYIAAFLGALYAGVIAVPTYLPRLNKPTPRFQTILADAQAAIALTTTSLLPDRERWAAHTPGLERLHWLTTDSLDPAIGATWQRPAISGESLAFLQYTSGSTAAPKGVILTHTNLLHNLSLIHTGFDATADDQGLIWLPPYHDMGLIGGILTPLYGGFPVTLMAPVDFLQRPLSWLEAITRFRATISGGPNFAYELCLHRIPPEQRTTLDLRSWRVAFNGAEPIRADTLHRFTDAFAPHGFRHAAFYPCYGLAEATLIVSGGAASAPPVVHPFAPEQLALSSQTGEAHPLVGCGPTFPDQVIAIADPETGQRCAPGQIGEIWVSGPSVAQGYWNRPDQSAHSFGARLADSDEGPFLRTGDLGLLHDGELFVTGRLKDLIIVRGRNHYPQDIELTVEQSHPALAPTGGAAFSVEVEGEERLVIVHEIERRARTVATEELFQVMRQAVAEGHELQLHEIVLLQPASIPKTTSGKIQRRACRAAYLADTLRVFARSHLDAPAEGSTPVAAHFDRATFEAAEDADTRLSLLLGYLHRQAATTLRLTPEQIAPHLPLSAVGLDSLQAIELKNEIESALNLSLSIPDILGAASLEALAQTVMPLLNEKRAAGYLPMLRPAPAQANLPLSFSQQRLWFLDQLTPNQSAYTIPIATRLLGSLELPALQQAVDEIVRRHEILRATFHKVSGQGVQRIAPPFPLPLLIEEVADEEALQAFIAEEARRPFSLETGPLLRARLVRLGAEHHVLLLTLHHIITDGWAMGVFLRELTTLYDAFLIAQPSPLPALPIQFTDYAYWQREWVQQGGLEPQRTYWREQLRHAPTVLELPTDAPRPTEPTLAGSHHFFEVPPALADALRELSRREQVTLYMTLLAAFKSLLHYHTGREDMVVGTDIANRHWRGTEGLIGFFVNQLVLRTNLAGNPPFPTLLQRVREVALGAFAHQDMPFDRLVELLQPMREANRNPLFQVMFVFENAPMPESAPTNLRLEQIEVDTGGSPFDLSVLISPVGSSLKVDMRYSTHLFRPTTIARLAAHYEALLRQIVATPQATLSELHHPLTEHDAQQQASQQQALRELRSQKFRALTRKTLPT